MKPVTLNFIDKLEEVLFSIIEKAAWYVFLHGQPAVRVMEFSGALRNVPHVVIDTFLLVYFVNWLYSGETLRFV